MPSSGSLEVVLPGGLGNQLFAYYAGYSLAERLGRSLVINARWAAHLSPGRKVSLAMFHTQGKWARGAGKYPKWMSVSGAPERLRASLRYRFPLYRRFEQSYVSEAIGYDDQIEKLTRVSVLQGYFASYRHVLSAQDAGLSRKPQLTTESDLLRRMRERCKEEQPIAVHVRRGDYLTSPGFGILSVDYFMHSLERIRAVIGPAPVWIFSDDKTYAHTVVRRQVPGEARVVEGLYSAPEELALMMDCNGAVISNSTFGWWGAWGQGASAVVIAPEPWFQAWSGPTDLLPPSWLSQQASWVDG